MTGPPVFRRPGISSSVVVGAAADHFVNAAELLEAAEKERKAFSIWFMTADLYGPDTEEERRARAKWAEFVAALRAAEATHAATADVLLAVLSRPSERDETQPKS